MSRSYEPITHQTLEFLRRLADREFTAFFERNPKASQMYEGRYFAACLCQGAAWHYVGKGDGVKDFDVHLFFWQHPERHIVSRVPKRYEDQDVPGFGSKHCDMLKTVVPEQYRTSSENEVEAIQQFLRDRPTSNAHHLAQKAVVGLAPDEIFATVIWE